MSDQHTPTIEVNIAVLIPCFNEAIAIPTVISDFRKHLPNATIYIFDNNSTDNTADIALKCGAIVRKSMHQGKGNVVRHMFSEVNADVYILVDGDATYDASMAPTMVNRLITDGLDMVVGKRVNPQDHAYRQGHQFGNKVLTGCVSVLFGSKFSDILSGYRAFSRRYIKSFPALATGFETETELTVHALELRMPILEVETQYKSRPDGSQSKLSTYADGARILWTILKLFRLERPIWYFSFIAFLLLSGGVAIGIPILMTYLDTKLVPRIPSVVLVTGLGLTALQFFLAGLILDALAHGRREAKRLVYLNTR